MNMYTLNWTNEIIYDMSRADNSQSSCEPLGRLLENQITYFTRRGG